MLRRHLLGSAFLGICALTLAAVPLASCSNGPSQASPLLITSGAPPNGTVGAAYSFLLTSSGGTAPYSWGWAGSPLGSILPPNLNVTCIDLAPLSPAHCRQGLITGVPTTAGTYHVDVQLNSFGSPSQFTTAHYTIIIAP